MDKYIIVRTLCDKEEVANKIIDHLLGQKLVAGSQVSTVHSKYWWHGKLEEHIEYKLEFRTRENLFNVIKNEITKIHNYDVAEISYSKIDGANEKFKEWLDSSLSDKYTV